MKVLYLVNDGPCSHDYGNDFLFTGFCNVLGFANVYDFPEKDCLHLPNIEARDDCSIDSDQCFPRKGHSFEDVVNQCDLAVLTSPNPILYPLCSRIPSKTPVVAVDFGDALGNFRQPYERVAARPLAAYFKRELPLGESFATPLPLSYPASRVPDPMPEKANRVFYWATSHGGGGAGQPRLRIAHDFATLTCTSLAMWQSEIIYQSEDGLDFRVNSPNIDVRITRGQAKGSRPSPEDYHARMAESLIGIHFNCAVNWDANRWSENFAYGLCQVAERPRIQMLNMAEDGVHCFYVDKPEQVAPLVKQLLEDEEMTRRVAEAGHSHWRRWHSSERRAEFIIESVGKLGA